MLEGIVQGYIVDAFSMVRGAETERDDDSSTNCLVCSLSKFKLQQIGVDFDEHIEEHHNRWSYLYLAKSVRSDAARGWLGTTAAIVKKALDQNLVDFMPLETTHEMDTSHSEVDKIDQLSGELRDHVVSLEDSIVLMHVQLHAKMEEVSDAINNIGH